MGTAVANVPEFGESGELWTSTGIISLPAARRGALRRRRLDEQCLCPPQGDPHSSTHPEYYSFQVADLSAHDKTGTPSS
jgi:hypothetical protein